MAESTNSWSMEDQMEKLLETMETALKSQQNMAKNLEEKIDGIYRNLEKKIDGKIAEVYGQIPEEIMQSTEVKLTAIDEKITVSAKRLEEKMDGKIAEMDSKIMAVIRLVMTKEKKQDSINLQEVECQVFNKSFPIQDEVEQPQGKGKMLSFIMDAEDSVQAVEKTPLLPTPSNSLVVSQKEGQRDGVLGDPKFQPPFPVPVNLLHNLSPTEKVHPIIARTAMVASKNGGQSEIILRVKQGGNPTFGFLMAGQSPHAYFRFLAEYQELLQSESEGKTQSVLAIGRNGDIVIPWIVKASGFKGGTIFIHPNSEFVENVRAENFSNVKALAIDKEEWNAPKPMHFQLLNGALQRQTSDQRESEIWSPLPNQGWKPFADSHILLGLPEKSQGYIQVFLDGGLNQQRMGVCDAVAVAKILNATLLIPHFEVNPVWQDSSSFTDIFDVDHFIDTLKNEVSIVKDLQSPYSWSTREYYGTGIRATRIKTAPLHASASWYLENVLPIMKSYGIAAIAPFSHRLVFDNLPSEIQHLQCKVNFEALVFVPYIRMLAEAIINRLRFGPSVRGASDVSNWQERVGDKRRAGKYVTLHLRFDKDMAAHSACDFGGGKAEKLALAKYRQVLWQGRVLNSHFTDEELRNQGRCPLTPEEIGLLLAALGFSNSTRLYLASHKVYGGEARISSLLKLFPFMEDKKSLTSAKERDQVEGKASLLAAVDYYVSMQSDIFISASPGNMHNALVAHRAYNNTKTIRPNMVLLGKLFINKSLEWSDFQQAVRSGHKNRQGQLRLRKKTQSIYTYPIPDCMCQV